MRALPDANVYISYLLSPDAHTPPKLVVDAAIDGAFVLLITRGVIDEVRRKTATKPYLSARITQPQVDRLIKTLDVFAESIPELEEPFPEIGRDRKDDYLFAHAVLGRADVLVSGDDDLHSIGEIGGVRILSPREFLHVLLKSGWHPR